MRRLLAGVLAPALLFCGAPAANAAVDSVGGFKYVTSKPIGLGIGKTERIKLSCPGGTHAYGGGQSNNGSYGELAQLQTYPLDDRDPDGEADDGWGLLMSNTGTAKRYLTAFAVCGSPGTKLVKEKVPLGPSEFHGETDTFCKHRRLVGGGVFGPARVVLGDGGPDMYSEGPVYETYLQNASGTKSATATQYAICASVRTKYVRVGAPAVGAMSQASAMASCPANTAVLNGGMGSSGGVSLNSSYPQGGFRDWLVLGDNKQSSPRDIDAQVVCGKHP